VSILALGGGVQLDTSAHKLSNIAYLDNYRRPETVSDTKLNKKIPAISVPKQQTLKGGYAFHLPSVAMHVFVCRHRNDGLSMEQAGLHRSAGMVPVTAAATAAAAIMPATGSRIAVY
jgi:hypothetical protein